MTVTRGTIQQYKYQPVVIREGRRVPEGKAIKPWKFSVNVAGNQTRRTGFASKAEAETALANRRHGPMTGDATEPAWNGYLLTVACPVWGGVCAVVTPEDADADLVRVARLN